MEKEFVPYEEALKLRDLGFDKPCIACYLDKQIDLTPFGVNYNKFLSNDLSFKDSGYNLSAPLYQQAFRFFREKYKLLAYIDTDIYSLYRFTIVNYVNIRVGGFKTYQEVELTCLRKLIEIVKEM